MVEVSTILGPIYPPPILAGQTVTPDTIGPTVSILAKKYQTLKRIPTFKRS
jgi:hypothetical protein